METLSSLSRQWNRIKCIPGSSSWQRPLLVGNPAVATKYLLGSWHEFLLVWCHQDAQALPAYICQASPVKVFPPCQVWYQQRWGPAPGVVSCDAFRSRFGRVWELGCLIFPVLKKKEICSSVAKWWFIFFFLQCKIDALNSSFANTS